MRTMEQHDNELVFDKKVYVGIDVHKESWHVTIRTLGEEVFNGRIPGSYISLKKVLDRYRGNSVKVAYEAGPFGFWLYDKLTEDGMETLVVTPSTIPVESGNKIHYPGCLQSSKCVQSDPCRGKHRAHASLQRDCL